jgi:DNA-binding SARP family transcriptional activator
VEIRILGELEVVRDGRARALPASKRTRALLGFLVATGQPHLRERLCELFWDGPDDPRASLRWSLAKLRPLVGDVLRADRERVGLSGVVVDLHEVRGVDWKRAPLEELRRAAERFRGELLDGLDLPDCFRYQAWCAAEREAARALRLSILEALGARLDGEPEEALAWARARLSVDPLSEAAHAQLVRCLHRAGRTRDALKHYDEARRLLLRELGAREGAELERARQECLRAPAPPVETTVEPTVERPAPAQASRVGLVGRGAERARLKEWVALAAAGEAHGVGLVVGDPGIGKTRLLDELAATMRAAGGRVLVGHAFEAEMLRPYGAWIDALHVLDTGELDEALRADAGPLLPRLTAPAPSDRSRLFDGAARLLEALAPAARPLLLLFDDLQWLDESSAALLHFVARARGTSRVLIACAARPGELADNRAALQTVRALAREQRLWRIDLGPLEPAEVAELVGDVDVERVLQSSGGNPLYALEVASALRSGEGQSGGTLDALFRERLEKVHGRARDLLPFAAALGHSFEPELLAATSGLAPADLLAAVDELERRGILRAAAGGGWDFSHDLVRDAAYRSLSEPRRRLVHLQIAQALARLPDPDGARAGERAHHAGLGGDLEAAARAWLAAGERCLRVFAQAEAGKAATRGIELAERLPPAVRAVVEVPLYAVRVFSRGAREPSRDLETGLSRAIITAEAAGEANAVQSGFHLLSTLAWRAYEFDRALESTVRSAEAGRTADPNVAARALATASRCMIYIEREVPRALRLAGEAHALAATHRLELAEVSYADGITDHYTGLLDRAVAAHQQALRLFTGSSDHWDQCMALLDLTTIELERRRFAEARGWAARAAQMAEKIGEGSEGPFAAALDALARHGQGLPAADAVEAALQRLVDIDARALLSYACNTLAELELEAGRPAASAAAARRALAAARELDRKSEIALALALLIQVEGDAALRAELQPLVDEGAALSARARRHVSAALGGKKEE